MLTKFDIDSKSINIQDLDFNGTSEYIRLLSEGDQGLKPAQHAKVLAALGAHLNMLVTSEGVRVTKRKVLDHGILQTEDGAKFEFAAGCWFFDDSNQNFWARYTQWLGLKKDGTRYTGNAQRERKVLGSFELTIGTHAYRGKIWRGINGRRQLSDGSWGFPVIWDLSTLVTLANETRILRNQGKPAFAPDDHRHPLYDMASKLFNAMYPGLLNQETGDILRGVTIVTPAQLNAQQRAELEIELPPAIGQRTARREAEDMQRQKQGFNPDAEAQAMAAEVKSVRNNPGQAL